MLRLGERQQSWPINKVQDRLSSSFLPMMTSLGWKRGDRVVLCDVM